MNLDDPIFEELNRQIDVSEVQSAINNLKLNKSVCLCDNLLNDYFIESSDTLSTHITDIFNKDLSTGYFPGSWAEGYIVPLHKKATLTMLIIIVEYH